ncbi:putative cyclin-dependent kinase F-2 [Panicum virgatum]|uniref:[RNA-polymerase]-subunit kinase n=1 Tax=Panicum virgatum TaxID=38727 RepID=A0A8T0NIS7_PANVG|nr:putative cyclin-dependent kinase F-2 [Panicum virgatum]KAG2546996.1 hypothetical protein PVAP13_9KG065600 [Panicum virgatum]
MAACVVEAAAAAAAGRPTRKRTRVAMGTTEDYEETCRLGEGAFGAVVKARHRATGRPVAIKRLGAALGGHATLLREAQLLEAGGRDNPFVAGFRGLARNPATMAICLVMEFVGPSLDDLLSQRPTSGGSASPPLPEATVRAAMWQLLSGATKMHERRVIHRDIKPSNILVSGGSVVKICDFGLAMSMDEPPPHEQAGTLGYMAPEMLLEKPDYDERVDAWSLGCVMAELVNGWSPFQGLDDDTEEGQLRAIFDVLGVPDDTTWPWFSSTAFAAGRMPELDSSVPRRNRLREHFPETKLSEEGFEVLNGLLTCNPEKWLTAAAALRHPWFAKIDALELPMREEVAPALPKRVKRLRVLCP